MRQNLKQNLEKYGRMLPINNFENNEKGIVLNNQRYIQQNKEAGLFLKQSQDSQKQPTNLQQFSIDKNHKFTKNDSINLKKRCLSLTYANNFLNGEKKQANLIKNSYANKLNQQKNNTKKTEQNCVKQYNSNIVRMRHKHSKSVNQQHQNASNNSENEPKQFLIQQTQYGKFPDQKQNWDNKQNLLQCQDFNQNKYEQNIISNIKKSIYNHRKQNEFYNIMGDKNKQNSLKMNQKIEEQKSQNQEFNVGNVQYVQLAENNIIQACRKNTQKSQEIKENQNGILKKVTKLDLKEVRRSQQKEEDLQHQQQQQSQFDMFDDKKMIKTGFCTFRNNFRSDQNKQSFRESLFSNDKLKIMVENNNKKKQNRKKILIQGQARSRSSNGCQHSQNSDKEQEKQKLIEQYNKTYYLNRYQGVYKHQTVDRSNSKETKNTENHQIQSHRQAIIPTQCSFARDLKNNRLQLEFQKSGIWKQGSLMKRSQLNQTRNGQRNSKDVNNKEQQTEEDDEEDLIKKYNSYLQEKRFSKDLKLQQEIQEEKFCQTSFYRRFVFENLQNNNNSVNSEEFRDEKEKKSPGKRIIYQNI